jgi:hypothetical protein
MQKKIRYEENDDNSSNESMSVSKRPAEIFAVSETICKWFENRHLNEKLV